MCLRHRRLLVVRPHGQDAYFLPGGVPEPGETLEEATVREVAEEVGIDLRPDELTLLTEIVTAAYGRPDTDVRLVCFTGPSDAPPVAIGEIAEVAWFTGQDAGRCASAIQMLIARRRARPSAGRGSIPGSADCPGRGDESRRRGLAADRHGLRRRIRRRRRPHRL
ncbi:NUDIX hydrolase [Krasilnikovia sp. MM14-A1259]|uniref:NUDIX hydrolase n=1 Tax=Krasilnikovia sp. MM14-A1259 TaxID=3373539 RepID=UPI00399CBD3A